MESDAGKKVGHDVAATAHKDEVVVIGICQRFPIGLGNGGERLALEAVRQGFLRNCCGWDGAMVVGLREIIDGRLGEHSENSIDVFVINHSEDHAELSARLGLDLRSQILPSANVVASVANDERVLLQGLPTTHEARVACDIHQGVSPSFILEFGLKDSQLAKLMGGTKNGAEIEFLVCAFKLKIG